MKFKALYVREVKVFVETLDSITLPPLVKVAETLIQELIKLSNQSIEISCRRQIFHLPSNVNELSTFYANRVTAEAGCKEIYSEILT